MATRVALADQIFYFKRLIRRGRAAPRLLLPPSWPNRIEGELAAPCISTTGGRIDDRSEHLFADLRECETREPSCIPSPDAKHLPAGGALLAPYVNSYRRYVPDFAAPINLEWGRDNRTTGLRVPISSPRRGASKPAGGYGLQPYLGLAAS